MITALDLLPENDVRLGLESLKEVTDGMCLRTILLLEYIERVYAGSEGSPGRFPLSTWNAHLQTLRRDPRTINLCEGWNDTLARLVGHSYPTTWNCIAAPQKDKLCSRRTIIQLQCGPNIPCINWFLFDWSAGHPSEGKCDQTHNHQSKGTFPQWIGWNERCRPNTWNIQSNSWIQLTAVLKVNWLSQACWAFTPYNVELHSCTAKGRNLFQAHDYPIRNGQTRTSPGFDSIFHYGCKVATPLYAISQRWNITAGFFTILLIQPTTYRDCNNRHSFFLFGWISRINTTNLQTYFYTYGLESARTVLE